MTAGTFTDAIGQFANHVLNGTEATPHVALGPVVWEIEQGHDKRDWYFVIASIGAKRNLRLDQFKIASDDRALAEKCRAALILEMVQRKPPGVFGDFDDELAMARWCEALAPGKRARSIRQALERERAATQGPTP